VRLQNYFAFVYKGCVLATITYENWHIGSVAQPEGVGKPPRKGGGLFLTKSVEHGVGCSNLTSDRPHSLQGILAEAKTSFPNSRVAADFDHIVI
jgi:hypothetical protein